MVQATVKVPTLDRSLSRVLGLPEDIKFIREKEGLSIGQLARILGVSKTEVWHWEKGNRMPKEPLIWLGLMDWAEELRKPAS